MLLKMYLFPLISIIYSGKFFISLTMFFPHKHVATHRSCTSLSTSAGESSFPSSWSCFYEAMPLLLQRCASGHCHPEWWNFSLSFRQRDPEGFGATLAVFRSSFHPQLWVKSQFKQGKLSNSRSNYHKCLSSLCLSGGPSRHSRIVNISHCVSVGI